MDHRFFIYTANHGKQDGIEDYLTLIKNVLGSRGFQVEVSSTLRTDGTNIIIDEFTNCIENRRIAEFRKNNPERRCVLVLTEFWERKFGVESFNHFGGLFDSATIALFNVYLRMFRNDFPAIRIRDMAALLLQSPVLIAHGAITLMKYLALKLTGKKVASPVAYFLRRHHRLIYFHMRYLGLMAHLCYADAVIASHEAITRGFSGAIDIPKGKLKFLGVVYPELDEQNILGSLMKQKNPFVEITGSITSNRLKWVNRLNNLIELSGIHDVFGLTKPLPFSLLSSGEKFERAAYSLHPPQTKNWPYCSPTRIYRALQVDHNLPVLTKHFGQNPIEDVCFILKDQRSVLEMLEMYSDRTAMLNFVTPRIRKYNEIVKQRNDFLVKSLVESSETLDTSSKALDTSKNAGFAQI